MMTGLGHAWLFRAQQCLARIHHNEGSSSSGESGGFGDHYHYHYTARDEARDTAREAREADARLHTADYVEARGILLPSTEYFARAIAAAGRSERVTGGLLSLVGALVDLVVCTLIIGTGSGIFHESRQRNAFDSQREVFPASSHISSTSITDFGIFVISVFATVSPSQLECLKQITDRYSSYLDDYGRFIDN